MDKIYSRRRIKIPKIKFLYNNTKEPNYKNIKKILKISCIMIVAFATARFILQAISPIIDKQCINMAKAIATKICNEQSTIVMSNYEYDDLCDITKETNRKYIND